MNDKQTAENIVIYEDVPEVEQTLKKIVYEEQDRRHKLQQQVDKMQKDQEKISDRLRNLEYVYTTLENSHETMLNDLVELAGELELHKQQPQANNVEEKFNVIYKGLLAILEAVNTNKAVMNNILDKVNK